jgi:hypothetical protein
MRSTVQLHSDNSHKSTLVNVFYFCSLPFKISEAMVCFIDRRTKEMVHRGDGAKAAPEHVENYGGIQSAYFAETNGADRNFNVRYFQAKANDGTTRFAAADTPPKVGDRPAGKTTDATIKTPEQLGAAWDQAYAKYKNGDTHAFDDLNRDLAAAARDAWAKGGKDALTQLEKQINAAVKAEGLGPVFIPDGKGGFTILHGRGATQAESNLLRAKEFAHLDQPDWVLNNMGVYTRKDKIFREYFYPLPNVAPPHLDFNGK